MNRETFKPVETGLRVIAACRAQAPEPVEFLQSSWEGRPPHFDLLIGNARVREGLLAGVAVQDLIEPWAGDAAQFKEKRKPYLLYD
jgi:uncharacterized protein YbbC (DUF1343 family)